MPVAQIAEGGNYTGAVGNIISAGLQTKGLIDQAAILQNFRDELEWIAAAGWLVSIVMGISAFAVFGNYRQAAYLLVGPPLFYYMITTTVQTNGVETKFGDRFTANAVSEQKKLHRWVRSIDGNEKIEISFFFALYDSIISELVQKTVSVVLSTDNKSDLKYIAREFALSHILQGVTENTQLTRLIAVHHMGDCGQELEIYSREMSQRENTNKEMRDDTDIEVGTKKVAQIWENKSVVLESRVKRFLNTVEGAEPKFNCDDSPPGTCDNDDSLSSCSEIWEYTKVSLIAHAKKLLTPDSMQGAQDSDTEYEIGNAISEVKKWLQEGAKEGSAEPEKILAVLLYKNTITKGTAESLQGQVFNRSPINSEQFDSVFGKLHSAEAAGGYFKLQYFSRSIPYIQGFLLYLLSIAFPFFAVFLVLPGKAPSFFAWCSLWAWVKSWDIGFALVHVTREIFWSMMRGSVNLFDAEEVWQGDPASVLKMAYQNDPLMGQNTYWLIVSILTCMVPVVTAHLAMGATNMFDMFKNSIDQTAIRFGQAEGNAARRHLANREEMKMDERNAMIARVGFTAAMNNPNATLVNGTSVYHANGGNGILLGGLTPNGMGRTVLNAASDASERYGKGQVSMLQFQVQMSTQRHRDGKAMAEIATLDSLGKSNALHNQLRSQAAQALAAGDVDKAASLNAQADSLYLIANSEGIRESAGAGDLLRAEADRAEAAGNTTLAQNLRTQATESDTAFEKVKSAGIEELNKGNPNWRTEVLPENIGHMNRGMVAMQSNMDQKSMATWAAELRRLADINERYGDHRAARQDRRMAEEIEAKIKNNQTVKWSEFVEREQKASDDLQLTLTALTRRRQYRLKNAHKVATFSNVIKARYETALHARSALDAVSSFKHLPVGSRDYQLNPFGTGYTLDPFGGSFLSKIVGPVKDMGDGDGS
jgi:hypothetical protein